MIPRPPRSTRTDTLFPYTTLFRSLRHLLGVHRDKAVVHPVAGERRAMVGAAALRDLVLMVREDQVLPARVNVDRIAQMLLDHGRAFDMRSEERRVGQECVSTCRSRWSPSHYKKKKKK